METKKSTHSSFDETEIRATIEKVFNAICDAFGRSDLISAADYFSNGPDMVKISNGHVLKGKEQMLAYWTKKIEELKGITITIELSSLQQIKEDCLWTIADEYISAPGAQMKAVVSNIFIREDSRWKILLDHTTYINS
jgi:ketosteroid isomerase-like protein